MPKKLIRARLDRLCSCCGKQMRVIVYSKSDYRGGHCFGKVPNYTKKAWNEALKAGTKPWKAGSSIRVLNVDPVAKSYTEYWECPKCYWRG